MSSVGLSGLRIVSMLFMHAVILKLSLFLLLFHFLAG